MSGRGLAAASAVAACALALAAGSPLGLSAAGAKSSGAAAASLLPRHAELLPAHAALEARIDVGALEALRAHVVAHGAGDKRLLLADAVLTIYARVIGFDATSTTSWQELGVDIAQPVLLSIDPPPIDASGAVVAAAGDPRPMWRSRLVASVVSPGRLEAALPRVAEQLTFLIELEHGDSDAVGAAFGSGATSGSGAAVVDALRKGGALYAGASPFGSAAIIVHRRGSALVVDVVAAHGAALDWSVDRPAILAMLRDPTAARASRRAKPSPKEAARAAALAAPGISIWIDTERSFDAVAAAAVADPALAVVRGRSCAALRSLATDGAFTGVALHASPSVAGLGLGVAWQLRPGAGLASALALADDALTALSSDVALSAALRLAQPAALRTLPRPVAFAGDPRNARWSVAMCSDALAPWIAAFAWPQWAGMWLDALASLSADFATVVDGARNVALAIQSMDVADFQGVVALEASFAAPAAEVIERGAELAFGHRVDGDATASEVVTRWGRGALRPFARAGGAVRTAGLGYGGSSVDWYLGLGAGAGGQRSLASVVVSGDRLARLGWPGLDAVRGLLPLLPDVQAELVLDGDTLRITTAPAP